MSQSSDVFDRQMLSATIALAKACVIRKEGGPFAAIVVDDKNEIGRGWNRVPSECDPTSHAEINAIRAACKAKGSFHLQDCVLYTSCEPCPMCWGAIQWARVSRVVYAANRYDAASVGFDDRHFYDELSLPMENRTPPAVNIPLPDKLEPFQIWHDMADRIHY